MGDLPTGTGPEQPPSVGRRRPRAARALGAAVVVGAAVALVVQNSQRVTVRFWFVTDHVRLIWVIVVCLVVAGAAGYTVGRRGRRRRRRRRRQPD